MSHLKERPLQLILGFNDINYNNVICSPPPFQVVTVLANMAAVETCFPDIATNDGLDLLVQFLYQRPPKYGTEAEIAACERVQQKAAIALTRLSREARNAQIVVELDGETRTLYHRDDALLYIAYVMLIWAAPIPADRWHCSL